ncbi:MAG: hypothetical protein ABEN55_21520, partial [Bradymonadaceae bacterium]
MSESAGHTVEIAEGNRTLRGLMREILDQEGFECVEGSESLADLLIIDVDSDDAGGTRRRETYEDSDRPVLICGLADSRGDYETDTWLDRPFNAGDLIGGEVYNCIGIEV